MKANLEKKKRYLEFLIKGEFTEDDFRKEYDDDELGFSSLGPMSPDRRNLIISDAKRHLKELLEKRPFLSNSKTETKPEKAVVEPKKVKEKK